jgi:hypothetical protein
MEIARSRSSRCPSKRDRRVAINAAALERLPIHEDIRAADVAEELDDIAEADALEVQFRK